MFKRFFAITLILAFVLSLAGCFGSAEKMEITDEKVVRIKDYLGSASTYYNVAGSSDAAENAKNRDDALKAYIDAAKETGTKIPEELIKSYVDSFKANVDASADEKDLEATAKALIKEELVIHIAYEGNADFPRITDDMRVDMAKKLAAELNCDVAAIFTPGNDTYTVDTAIKEELVKKHLLAKWDSKHGNTTEESKPAEESSVPEASEDSSVSSADETVEASAA